MHRFDPNRFRVELVFHFEKVVVYSKEAAAAHDCSCMKLCRTLTCRYF
jgi:hypothetical protein